MKLIRIKNNGEAVTAEIRVTGLVLWRFQYAMDEFSRSRAGDDDTVHAIVLGPPETVDGISSEWIFTVINAGNKARKFNVSIRWTQGGKKIASWSGRGTVRAGKTARRRGESAFLVRKDGGS